jgi:hypothetical protein
MAKAKKLLPNRIATIYTAMAVVLVPWIVYLSISLPTRNITKHWDLSWVGLDILIMFDLFLTGFFSKINSSWVIVTASSAGSFLLIDAWFDIIRSKPGLEIKESITLAVFVELPISIYSFYLARRAIKKISK